MLSIFYKLNLISTAEQFMIPQEQEDRIVFGSFPVRGHIMPCRLICEYLGIKYVDKFFDPRTWEEYKQKQAANWTFKQLPFLKDGQFVLTNVFAISGYLAEKSNRMDLLGSNFQEESTLNTFFGKQSLIQGVMALECQMKKLSDVQKQQGRKKYWKQKFQLYFTKTESTIHEKWFFSHITVADFFIYENYNLLSRMTTYAQQIKKFPNIAKIARNIGQLTQIKSYEGSQRSVKQMCPIRYFAKFVNECKQSSCFRSQPNWCKEKAGQNQ